MTPIDIGLIWAGRLVQLLVLCQVLVLVCLDDRALTPKPTPTLWDKFLGCLLSVEAGYWSLGLLLFLILLERRTFLAVRQHESRLQDPSEVSSVFVEADTLEPRLAKVARSHSRDMAERGYFEHVSPEGRDVAERALRAGIRYRRIGENIAFNLGARRPARTAMEGWMESKGHRDNILEGRYTRTGVGVALSAGGGLYFTQVFLLPVP